MEFLRHTKYQFIMTSMILLFASTSFARDTDEDTEKHEPPLIGNLALPTSQQIGPLISFGQSVIDKHQQQVFLFGEKSYGNNQNNIVNPFYVYAYSDTLAFLASAPIAVDLKMNDDHSAGFEDALVQAEYAYYNASTAKYYDQGTVLAYMSFPTGSDHKNPPTGFGAPGYFFGTTFNRTYVDWYVFTSEGALLTSSNHNTKFGNEFLYQFGLEKVIASEKGQWIFAGLIELDGNYSQKNRIDGETDPNSGGNVVSITPSLFLSTKKWMFQLGVSSFPVQNLNGDQSKMDYSLIGQIGYTIV